MRGNKKTILVIDDDPDILDAAQFILEDEGFIVQTSEKGDYSENLQTKKSTLPDLIIIDVLLSGRDGRIICKNLKTNKRTKHIPIIMISAHPGADASVSDVGADAFLAKPFNVDTLLDLVRTYL